MNHLRSSFHGGINFSTDELSVLLVAFVLVGFLHPDSGHTEFSPNSSVAFIPGTSSREAGARAARGLTLQ